jgi:hypothetical protein
LASAGEFNPALAAVQESGGRIVRKNVERFQLPEMGGGVDGNLMGEWN